MGWIENNNKDCKKATFLIEKGMHTKLNLDEKIKLQLHLLSCSWCKTYQHQSKYIETMVGNLFSEPKREKLTADFKNNLQLLIKEKLNKSK